ncbi:MAG TPA: alkaline phosphatase family protein [Bryobacteraceae bacterium]|nr:alkaline phosphatase family protein [Bryobacteraceae bacterium]
MKASSVARREFLAAGAAFLSAPAFARKSPQRAVVIMCDGFGLEYLEQSDMPALARWRKQGLFRRGRATMPSVTNTNNASICCGVWPDQHGITGNSYFERRSGREEYMETVDLLLAPTLFQRAKKRGVKSALLSSKKKTTTLLAAGADLILTPEEPPDDWVRRLGPAPGIYTREINYWLMTAAIDVLKNRRDLGCLYVHTTDYPMHTWPPEAAESKEHLARLDQFLGEAEAAAPDAGFLLTADHGMNHKSRCWDLEKACAEQGAPIRIAISVERDKYLKHHRGYGGVSWVYTKAHRDVDSVAKVLTGLAGVETVMTRSEAAKRFHLMASRIGDLAVLGDRDTVFGELDAVSEPLPPEYRAHGSLHELDVPLVIFNAHTRLRPEDFQYNRDLARWLYAG